MNSHRAGDGGGCLGEADDGNEGKRREEERGKRKEESEIQKIKRKKIKRKKIKRKKIKRKKPFIGKLTKNQMTIFNNPFSSSSSSSSNPKLELDNDDDDAQLLLPSHNGQTHKRLQSVKHSISYLFLSAAAAFALVMMVWLGPGLVNHDPHGLTSQSNAHVGYLQSDPLPANSSSHSIPISSSFNSSSSGKKQLSVDKPPVESTPLPPHPWNPLLNDPAPITHIYVKPCMFPPWALQSFCTPHQTAREIALYGKWVRVPRDISKGVGHYYTEIYYRRAQTLDLSSLDVQPITGLKILDEDEIDDPKVKAELSEFEWHPAGEDLRTGIWPTKLTPAKLYYTRSKKIQIDGSVPHPINEVSVLWSHKSALTQPWWGFERLNKPVFDGDNPIDHIQCDIVVRRHIVNPTPLPALTFQKDGKFKIMQISDLHFSASGGECKLTTERLSAIPNPIADCKEKGGADRTTMAWLSVAIAEAAPDLIVLGGDQLLGGDKTFDTISTLTKIGHFFAAQNVPWTVVFGNHDVDKSLAIEEQMYLFKHMPLFVGRAGPAVPGFDEELNPPSLHQDMGVGNFVLKVNASRSDPTQLLSLYFLDSHDYPRTTLSQIWELAMGGGVKYDWLKKSQIEWYKRESSSQPTLKRPYRSNEQVQGAKESRETKPIGLMFFHIPLPEAYGTADVNPVTKGELVFGNQKEKPLAAQPGDQFFQNAILQTSIDPHQTSDRSHFEPEIKLIANGHAHMTDTCRKHAGVYHCFSGLSSYSGEVKKAASFDWARRVRVFEVDRFGERLSTFQIMHDLDASPAVVRFGHRVLFDSDSAPAPAA